MDIQILEEVIIIVTDDFDKIIGEVHSRIKDLYIECGDYKKINRKI